MRYDQAYALMTGRLGYGPVSARGLLHAAQTRGSVTDAGLIITAIRNPDRWFFAGR